MNNSFEKAEKGLKRWLKREAKITMATIVTFLITGAVGYAEEIVTGKTFYTFDKSETYNTTVKDLVINGGKGFFIGKDGITGTIGSNVHTITVKNGGTAFSVEKAGFLKYDAGRTINVLGGRAFNVSNKGKIELTSGAINISGNGMGIIASNGTVFVGNGVGNKDNGWSSVIMNVTGGKGVVALENSTIKTLKDSYINVSNDGTGVLLNGTSTFDNNSSEFIVDGESAIGIQGTGTVKGNGTITVKNGGTGLHLTTTNSTLNYESGKILVSDNGIGAYIGTGGPSSKLNLNFGANAEMTVNANSTGVKFNGATDAIFVNNSTKGITVSGENAVGFLGNGNIQGNGIITVKDGGTGIKVGVRTDNTGGEIFVHQGGTINVESKDAVGILIDSKSTNGRGAHFGFVKGENDLSILNVNNGGTGVNLVSGEFTLYDKGTITVNNGIGIKGQGIVAGEGIIKVKKGTGLYAGAGETLNYNSGTIETTSGVGVLVDGGTVNFGDGQNTDTLLDVNQGTGIEIKEGGKLTLNKDAVLNVTNGTGIKINGGNAATVAGSVINVNGENSIGVDFLKTGQVRDANATVNVEKGIGYNSAVKDVVGTVYTGETSVVTTVKKEAIGFNAVNGGRIYFNDSSTVNVNGGTGFYTNTKAANNGYGIQLTAGGVNISEGGTGYIAENGVIQLGNNTGKGQSGAVLTTVNNGTGALAKGDSLIILNNDSQTKIENGIGINLKGTSTFTNNATSNGIVVNNNSTGINVSGAGENNNVIVNGQSGAKITVNGTGKGLYASDSGNVLNYQIGTIETEVTGTVGVLAENGATINLGNNISSVSDNPFDTFLTVKEGTGIKIAGANSTVNVGIDVKLAVTKGTGVEITGGIFNNNGEIYVENGTTGINISSTESDKVKVTNNGVIDIKAGGTGFTGTGNVINNGNLVLDDTTTDDTDKTRSHLGTGIKITSNGSITLGDYVDDKVIEDKVDEFLEKIHEGKVELDIKGLIKNKNGKVIYVAGTSIGGTEIPGVGPGGKVTVGSINEVGEEKNEDTFKVDEDKTITGGTDETGKELTNKVINVGGKLTVEGGGEGLFIKDVQINGYDPEGNGGDPDEKLIFTGKVTVNNKDSGKKIDSGNDNIIIGTDTGEPKTTVSFIGGEITGGKGKTDPKVIIKDEAKLVIDETNVGLDITGDVKTGTSEGIGEVEIGTNVTTKAITGVDEITVTGTGNGIGEIISNKVTMGTGEGKKAEISISGNLDTDELIFKDDGTVEVKKEGNIDRIVVDDNKYGEVLGGTTTTKGIEVGINGKLSVDGTLKVEKDDKGKIDINVEKDGLFESKGDSEIDGDLDINSGNYSFGSEGGEKGTKTTINGNIFVDEGTLAFKGNNIISVGTNGTGGTIKVGLDKEGNSGLTSFDPESKFAENSKITFETGKNGQINIGLADGDNMNSILGNAGKGTTLDFSKTEYGTVKFNTDRLTKDKVITLNTTSTGNNPYVTGFDQDDVGQVVDQLDNVYIAEVDEEKGIITLTYNGNLLTGYGEKINAINKGFQVINDKVDAEIDRILGENADDKEARKEVRAKLADSIYSSNIYSETVKASYDSLKMSEDAILSLNHRVKKGEIAGEGKALYSKNEYDRNGILGSTSSKHEFTGLLGAVEYGLTDNTRVGGVFSGTLQDIESENGTSDGTALYFGAYINKETSKYSLTAGAGYQLNKFESDNTYLSNTGTEKYDSNTLSVYVQGKYKIDLGDGLSFQPKAKLGYSYIDQDEVKDNMFGLEDTEIGIFEVEAGFDVVKSVYAEKSKVDVVFGASLVKAMGDTDKEFTGRFYGTDGTAGSSFDVLGAEIGENKIRFNLGAEVSNENGFFYNGGFTYSFGSNSTKVYGVNIGAGYKF